MQHAPLSGWHFSSCEKVWAEEVAKKFLSRTVENPKTRKEAVDNNDPVLEKEVREFVCPKMDIIEKNNPDLFEKFCRRMRVTNFYSFHNQCTRRCPDFTQQ